jgi:protein-disulfide isomerase
VGFGQQLVSIRNDQRLIREDVAELKRLVGSRPSNQAAAAAPVAAEAQPMVAVADARFKGDAAAKVTLVEFSDYQCPFCARHVTQTIPQIDRDYIRNGKVKYVFRNFPISSIHPQATKAAEAAECAGDQGRFWEVHDRLYRNQQKLSQTDLVAHARAENLNMGQFEQCLSTGQHSAKVRRDLIAGRAAGVTGTPAFYIGLTVPGDGEIKAVKVIKGARSYEEFRAAIDELLGQT